jgi:hypothetical protein
MCYFYHTFKSFYVFIPVVIIAYPFLQLLFGYWPTTRDMGKEAGILGQEVHFLKTELSVSVLRQELHFLKTELAVSISVMTTGK